MVFVERKKIENIFAWLFIMSIIPIVGFFFYLMFGNGIGLKTRRMINKTNIAENISKNEILYLMNKINQDIDLSDYTLLRKYEQLIKMNVNYGKGFLTFNNKLKFYSQGKDYIDDLLIDIENAKHHIHVDYYIFASDNVGKKIIDALTKKCQMGIKVRVIIDSVGSLRLKRKCFKNLIKAGGEFYEFFPAFLHFKLFNTKINYRNHRKIVIIDGKIGYTGGINFRDDHMGNSKKLSPWSDAQIRVEGASVYALQNTFFSDYRYAIKDKNDKFHFFKNEYYPYISTVGCSPMQIITSGPNTDKKEIKSCMIKMINMAKVSIKIATPYFVPDEVFLTALKIALNSNISVDILIPLKPDLKLTYGASLSYLQELEKLGAKIHFFEGFIHSKYLITDNDICTLGTCNCDNRSFSLNFEINAVIYDEKFTKILVKSFENNSKCNIIKYKQKFNKISFYKKFINSLFRLWSPLL